MRPGSIIIVRNQTILSSRPGRQDKLFDPLAHVIVKAGDLMTYIGWHHDPGVANGRRTSVWLHKGRVLFTGSEGDLVIFEMHSQRKLRLIDLCYLADDGEPAPWLSPPEKSDVFKRWQERKQ